MTFENNYSFKQLFFVHIIYRQLYGIKYFYLIQIIYGDARGVMVIVVGNGHGDTSSNPGLIAFSHSANTLGKGMNRVILPPAVGKSSALGRQLVLEKEDSEFKPVKLRLKIDLVSYPARVEGLVNRINQKLQKSQDFIGRWVVQAMPHLRDRSRGPVLWGPQ